MFLFFAYILFISRGCSVSKNGNHSDRLGMLFRNYVLLHFCIKVFSLYIEPVIMDSIYLLFQNIEGW